MMYTDVGRVISSKLWTETLQDLEFADPEAILGMTKKP